MNAFDDRRAKGLGQFVPKGFGDERHEWGDHLGQFQQRLVQRPKCVVLILRLFVAGPKPIATATNKPIAQSIQQRRDRLARIVVIQCVHPINNRCNRLV